MIIPKTKKPQAGLPVAVINWVVWWYFRPVDEQAQTSNEIRYQVISWLIAGRSRFASLAFVPKTSAHRLAYTVHGVKHSAVVCYASAILSPTKVYLCDQVCSLLSEREGSQRNRRQENQQ